MLNLILSIVPVALKLINNIFSLFKTSSHKKGRDRVSDRMEEIDDQIDDARKSK